MPKIKASSTKIVEAVLFLAASKGWEGITLEAIARRAKLSIHTVRQDFDSPAALVPLILDVLDREAFAQADITGSPKERLFELHMARLERFQKNRAGVIALFNAARRDKALACRLTRATGTSVKRLTTLARLDTLPTPVLFVGLAGLHVWILRVWMRDDTSDLRQSMAALDRALRWGKEARSWVQKGKMRPPNRSQETPNRDS